MESVIINLNNPKERLFGKIIDSVDAMTGHDASLKVKRVEIKKEKFSDGELCVSYLESIRGKRVYILSSPRNSDDIMYLNLAIDAAKRSTAKEIIPIIPYFPYQRSDKKDQTRGPIGAKMVAEMIENRGATGIITFDLHADQIQGFFNIPITHLEGKNIFDTYIKSVYTKDTILCGPDAGSGKRVQRMKNQLRDFHDIDLSYVMLEKTRSVANKVDEIFLIGDVKGKDVIILDDIIDTAGTLSKATDCLLEAGAKSVKAVITHGVLSGDAYKNIGNSKLTQLIISDSLEPSRVGKSSDVPEEYIGMIQGSLRIKTVSVFEQIGYSIIAINSHSSYEGLKNKRF